MHYVYMHYVYMHVIYIYSMYIYTIRYALYTTIINVLFWSSLLCFVMFSGLCSKPFASTWTRYWLPIWSPKTRASSRSGWSKWSFLASSLSENGSSEASQIPLRNCPTLILIRCYLCSALHCSPPSLSYLSSVFLCFVLFRSTLLILFNVLYFRAESFHSFTRYLIKYFKKFFSI